MTIERRRAIQVGDRVVKLPLTKKTVHPGSSFEFRSSVPRQVSIDGSPVHAGYQVATSALTALTPHELEVDYQLTFERDVALLDAMDDLSEESVKPQLLGGKKGVLKDDQINGTVPPTDKRIKTLFSYKPSK